MFLGILVAVNYLGTRQNKRWDLTANQVYSLSDQTIKILKDLKEPVQVTVFERNDRQDAHKDRLQEYQYQTTQLKTEYIDPDREPTRAGRGEGRVAADDPVRIQGPHRARHVDQRTGPHQRADQGHHRHRRARSTSRRATARRTPPSTDRGGYSTASSR